MEGLPPAFPIENGWVPVPNNNNGQSMEEGRVVNHAGSSSQRKQKAGIRWTDDEHKAFLVGLETYGKGSWSTISTLLVPTKTTSQVASHAQKYLRRVYNKTPSQRRRSSIHDTRILESGTIVHVSPRLISPPSPTWLPQLPTTTTTPTTNYQPSSPCLPPLPTTITTTNYMSTEPNYTAPIYDYNQLLSTYASSSSSYMHTNYEMPITYSMYPPPEHPTHPPLEHTSTPFDYPTPTYTDQDHSDFLYMLSTFSPVNDDTTYN